ncbi:alpha/beta hydrolase [Streptomyces sp. FIT100]|uniref:alpha/beta hydrolase n=1 Tax=Streptomyces sp. FIT100 TaxID=2837956 RepID=UPI0021C91F7B|nr:alpha/beta hydrolase [Streptomyces sp. FIT100]UUN30207.1 alpha/beta hydrolase [Streptomyces sp. FIT100]
MYRRTGALLAVGAAVTGLVAGAPSTATAGTEAGSGAGAGAGAPKWTRCATEEYPRLECSELTVPLDHANPGGRRITLALSRVRHTAKTFQGPLLVNPGGPGASGRKLAGFVAASLPAKVAAQYDIVGFDPRGVGASKPALNCKPGHFAPVRPDSVPHGRAEEAANLARASAFTRGCKARHADVLPHINTPSTAKDMDLIRQSLGAEQISYLGYSYGTYLGAVYAKLFPHRVRRAVLDSVVDPRGVWYGDNLDQDLGFDARHKAFAAWVARHDATYRLGSDPARVEAAWYVMREALRREPAGGKVGPGELENTFMPGGYYNGFWPYLAEAFAAYVNRKDSAPLVEAHENFGAVDAAGDNSYSVYTAVQCRDAAWPRDWGVWRRDNWTMHAKAPFSTWNNAWYNAPCATWPVAPLAPVDVTNVALPPVLVLQATDDAATPYAGAVAVHHKLHGSSLVVEQGGANHAVTLAGNACLDRYLTDYLATGRVPRAAGGGEADAACAASPEPKPLKAAARAALRDQERAGAALHTVLGHRNGRP